jgi:hypothetical protein
MSYDVTISSLSILYSLRMNLTLKEKAVKALPTFQLSITKKTKRREDKKVSDKGDDKAEDNEKMDVEKKGMQTFFLSFSFLSSFLLLNS